MIKKFLMCLMVSFLLPSVAGAMENPDEDHPLRRGVPVLRFLYDELWNTDNPTQNSPFVRMVGDYLQQLDERWSTTSMPYFCLKTALQTAGFYGKWYLAGMVWYYALLEGGVINESRINRLFVGGVMGGIFSQDRQFLVELIQGLGEWAGDRFSNERFSGLVEGEGENRELSPLESSSEDSFENMDDVD